MEQEKLPKDFFKQFKSKEDFQSFFSELYKQGVEQMLQAELDEHLGYQKHAVEGHNSGSSRNGSYPKKVKTDSLGDMVLKKKKGKYHMNTVRNRRGPLTGLHKIRYPLKPRNLLRYFTRSAIMCRIFK